MEFSDCGIGFRASGGHEGMKEMTCAGSCSTKPEITTGLRRFNR
jgi:hypothetical protein